MLEVLFIEIHLETLPQRFFAYSYLSSSIIIIVQTYDQRVYFSKNFNLGYQYLKPIRDLSCISRFIYLPLFRGKVS